MFMRKFTKIKALRYYLANWRKKAQTIALVPTMGGLHAGHLELIKKAQQLADKVIVSIFVNPTQFGENEDFDRYPRTIKEDRKLLKNIGTDMLFQPAVDEMYQVAPKPAITNFETQVIVPRLNNILCGKSRPNHFNGVSTIVSKLFNIVQPNVALFGKKDYQQLLLIKKLVNDLCLPIKVASIETVRACNGLALSSRHSYLDKQQWDLAAEIYQTLCSIAKAIQAGNTDYLKLENQALTSLEQQGFKVDYLCICNASDLTPATDTKLIALTAVWLGKIRLIDNIQIQCNQECLNY